MLAVPYYVLAELAFETVFEIRQLLVGDISLSPEYWRPVIENSYYGFKL